MTAFFQCLSRILIAYKLNKELLNKHKCKTPSCSIANTLNPFNVIRSIISLNDLNAAILITAVGDIPDNLYIFKN